VETPKRLQTHFSYFDPHKTETTREFSATIAQASGGTHLVIPCPEQLTAGVTRKCQDHALQLATAASRVDARRYVQHLNHASGVPCLSLCQGIHTVSISGRYCVQRWEIEEWLWVCHSEALSVLRLSSFRWWDDEAEGRSQHIIKVLS
jgi:hypothetical protein